MSVLQGGPKECTFSTHHIGAIVRAENEMVFYENVLRADENKYSNAVFMQPSVK